MALPLPHDLLRGIVVYLEFSDVGVFEFGGSIKIAAGADAKDAMFAQ